MLKRFLAFSLAGVLLMPAAVSAQDYALYESTYLKVLPGHDAAFKSKLAEHNRAFHSEGAYTAAVDSVVTGTYSGQYAWIMGPATFTALDGRPSGDPHDADWDEVLAHAEAHSNEYWRLNENLSSPQPETDTTERPILRVRFFEVADNALFRKTQRQIEEVGAADGGTGRLFFRRQFAHRDGRDWALVTAQENWAALDVPGAGNFRQRFIEVHGEEAWEVFGEERAQAVVGTEDEFRQRMTELGGAGNQ